MHKERIPCKRNCKKVIYVLQKGVWGSADYILIILSLCIIALMVVKW